MGSEMCIRDRLDTLQIAWRRHYLVGSRIYLLSATIDCCIIGNTSGTYVFGRINFCLIAIFYCAGAIRRAVKKIRYIHPFIGDSRQMPCGYIFIAVAFILVLQFTPFQLDLRGYVFGIIAEPERVVMSRSGSAIIPKTYPRRSS